MINITFSLQTKLKCFLFVFKSLLWGKNFKCAAALSVVRINLMKRGKDQVRNIIGVIDSRDRNWENRFSNSIDLDSLKCSYLHEPELNLGRMDQSSINCYFEILRELSEFCFNDHIYQVLMMSSPEQSKCKPQGKSFGLMAIYI
jgi:hypothetical protein